MDAILRLLGNCDDDFYKNLLVYLQRAWTIYYIRQFGNGKLYINILNCFVPTAILNLTGCVSVCPELRTEYVFIYNRNTSIYMHHHIVEMLK